MSTEDFSGDIKIIKDDLVKLKKDVAQLFETRTDDGCTANKSCCADQGCCANKSCCADQGCCANKACCADKG